MSLSRFEHLRQEAKPKGLTSCDTERTFGAIHTICFKALERAAELNIEGQWDNLDNNPDDEVNTGILD